MDGRQFDDLLVSLSENRRSLLGAALGAALGLLGFAETDTKGKKKKKKCVKKCKDGCCTGKRGKCIQPAQQNATQCGTGGEICRTNCGGGVADTCGLNCATCCANGDCIDPSEISNAQCGAGGEACFACPSGQTCNAPGAGCCARKGATCRSNGAECCAFAGITCGPDNFCCVQSASTSFLGSCDSDLDCCDPIDVCQDGQCKRPEGATCQPGNLLCESPLGCISGICDTINENCDTACAEKGHCEFLDCGGNQMCCNLFPCTSPPGERCNCLEGGQGCSAVDE